MVDRRGHRYVGGTFERHEARHYELSTIAAVAAIVSAAVSTGAAVYSYKRQAAASDEAAKQQENEAETARQTAEFNERQHRRKMALLLGKQEATYAAAGFDIDTGSPLEAHIDLVKQGELEALSIRREGAIVGAERAYQASVARFEASGARTSAVIAGIGGTAKAAGAGARGYRSVATDWGTG